MLWELSCYKPFASDNTSSDHDSDDENVHCLPFKVVGTCYSLLRQKTLEAAYDYIHTFNRPVFAKLVAEPENPTDKNAIAVSVMTDECKDFEKVGLYTKRTNQILTWSVKSIKIGCISKRCKILYNLFINRILYNFKYLKKRYLGHGRLDFPSTCRLFVGLPGVLPSTTLGLFAAMLNHPVKMSAKHVTFKSIKSDFPEGSAGERSNNLCLNCFINSLRLF